MKHVEFYSKNIFEKLFQLFVFIIRIGWPSTGQIEMILKLEYCRTVFHF